MWNYKICIQKKIKLQPEIQQNFIRTNLEYSNLERGMRVNPSFDQKHNLKSFKVDFIFFVYREVFGPMQMLY